MELQLDYKELSCPQRERWIKTGNPYTIKQQQNKKYFTNVKIVNYEKEVQRKIKEDST